MENPDQLKQALDEMQEYIDGHYDEEDAPDAWEMLAQECGKLEDGSCLHAGSEQCEFECPFR